MIKLSDSIWIGNAEENILDVKEAGITAVLNVAHDLYTVLCGWPEFEYAQVGLIDGPGNTTSAYYAAILELTTLLQRHKRVMLFCHGGRRSLAVVVMYLCCTGNIKWDVCMDMLRERVDVELPEVHDAHKEAFNRINWRPMGEIGDV